jgi:hypothetical protein
MTTVTWPLPFSWIARTFDRESTLARGVHGMGVDSEHAEVPVASGLADNACSIYAVSQSLIVGSLDSYQTPYPPSVSVKVRRSCCSSCTIEICVHQLCTALKAASAAGHGNDGIPIAWSKGAPSRVIIGLTIHRGLAAAAGVGTHKYLLCNWQRVRALRGDFACNNVDSAWTRGRCAVEIFRTNTNTNTRDGYLWVVDNTMCFGIGFVLHCFV